MRSGSEEGIYKIKPRRKREKVRKTKTLRWNVFVGQDLTDISRTFDAAKVILGI